MKSCPHHCANLPHRRRPLVCLALHIRRPRKAARIGPLDAPQSRAVRCEQHGPPQRRGIPGRSYADAVWAVNASSVLWLELAACGTLGNLQSVERSFNVVDRFSQAKTDLTLDLRVRRLNDFEQGAQIRGRVFESPPKLGDAVDDRKIQKFEL